MENGPFIDGLPIKNGDFPWLCQITRGQFLILSDPTPSIAKISGCRASIATMEECFNAEFVSLHVSSCRCLGMTWETWGGFAATRFDPC